MLLQVLAGALSAVLSLTGEIAFIDTAAGEGGMVYVLGLATPPALAVGPGREDGAPRWSPDGAWLAFESNTDGGRGIYVVDAAGRDGHLIHTAAAWNTAPCWSTDGGRLAYCSAVERGGAAQLRVYDLNTGEESVWGGGRAGIACPVWMPYNQLMLLLSPRRELNVPGVDMQRLLSEAQLRLLDIGGKKLPQAVLAIELAPSLPDGKQAVQTRLVVVSKSEVLPLQEILVDSDRAKLDGVVWDVTPNWSGYRYTAEVAPGVRYGARALANPGATTRIAFESNAGADREIYVLKKGVENVTNNRAADWNPVWSPDGKSLAFESFRGGNRGIYLVFTDTAHVEEFAVRANADCWSPSWKPDGAALCYISDRSGLAELYATVVRGGETVQLSDGGGPKEAPSWRPE